MFLLKTEFFTSHRKIETGSWFVNFRQWWPIQSFFRFRRALNNKLGTYIDRFARIKVSTGKKFALFHNCKYSYKAYAEMSL